MINTLLCAPEEFSILQGDTYTLKDQGLKQILLFIRPIFIKHLLRFPDTIVSTENTAKQVRALVGLTF